MARLAVCTSLRLGGLSLRRSRHFRSQNFQPSLRASGQPFHITYRGFSMADAITLHCFYRRINKIEQVEPKFYSGVRHFPPMFLSFHLDNGGFYARTLIEKLPSRQHRQEQECISIVETLQSIGTTAQKDEVVERRTGRKTCNSRRSNLSFNERAPGKELRHELRFA